MLSRTALSFCFALLSVALMPAAQALGVHADTSAEGPAQTVYAAPNGRGRVVVMLSGHSGPDSYEPIALNIAKLGYDVVLLDGKEIYGADGKGKNKLQQAIARAQKSPDALPGKVAVIGYSQGGGGALTFATRMPDSVAVVIAYYPMTSFIAKHHDLKTFVGEMQVPVLMMVGEADTYKDCCLLDTALMIGSVAKELGVPFELVTYPHVKHGFNHVEYATSFRLDAGVGYDANADADAWKHTVAMLAKYLSN